MNLFIETSGNGWGMVAYRPEIFTCPAAEYWGHESGLKAIYKILEVIYLVRLQQKTNIILWFSNGLIKTHLVSLINQDIKSINPDQTISSLLVDLNQIKRIDNPAKARLITGFSQAHRLCEMASQQKTQAR